MSVALCETPTTDAPSTCRRFLLVSASTVDSGALSGVVRGLRTFRVQLLICLPLAKIVVRMLVAIFLSTPQYGLGGFLSDAPYLPSPDPHHLCVFRGRAIRVPPWNPKSQKWASVTNFFFLSCEGYVVRLAENAIRS